MSDRLADYYRFHEIQVESDDMDPAYPVLEEVASVLGLGTEERLWLVLVYAAYYHLGSGLLAFGQVSDPRGAADAALDLPCATERRGHWSRPRLLKHLQGVQSVARDGSRGLTRWFLSNLHGTPEENWRLVQHRAGLLPGNGRWAAFKTTELIQRVVAPGSGRSFDLHAPDMQHAHSSGPRKGLGLLFEGLPTGNGPGDIALLDAYSSRLVGDMKRHGLVVTMETAETSLCDFHSLVRGHYYPGHDIDQMQLQLDAVPSRLSPYAWRARRRRLPEHYLGELTGRTGLDRAAAIHYRTTGRIPLRTTTGELR